MPSGGPALWEDHLVNVRFRQRLTVAVLVLLVVVAVVAAIVR